MNELQIALLSLYTRFDEQREGEIEGSPKFVSFIKNLGLPFGQPRHEEEINLAGIRSS